jgi:hypothetical protein
MNIGLALVNDGTSAIEIIGNEDRDGIRRFVGGVFVVYIGTSVSNFGKSIKGGRCSGCNSSGTMSKKLPALFELVAGHLLVAIASLVNIGRALPDEGDIGGDGSGHLVRCFVFGIFIEGFGAAVLVTGRVEDGGSGGCYGSRLEGEEVRTKVVR